MEWCEGQNECITPGSKCIPRQSIIIGVVLGSFVFIALVVVGCIYCKSKKEGSLGGVSGNTQKDDEFLAYRIGGRFG